MLGLFVHSSAALQTDCCITSKYSKRDSEALEAVCSALLSIALVDDIQGSICTEPKHPKPGYFRQYRNPGKDMFCMVNLLKPL